MPAIGPGARKDLEVVRQLKRRYLFNYSGRPLRRIRLADQLISVEAELIFPTPVYEVESLPPHSFVRVPASDEKLDGYPRWRVDWAVWTEGRRIEGPLVLPQTKVWGGAVFEEQEVDREVIHVKTEPGSKLNENCQGSAGTSSEADAL